MALPPGILSVDLIVCERVLREKDDVASAIRMIVLFNVSESHVNAPNPVLVFSTVTFIRGDTGASADLLCRMTLTDPKGREIAEQEQRVQFEPGAEGIPGGAAWILQFNVDLLVGVYRLRAFVDGELASQTTVAIRQVPG